jgi:hypothetical protein
VKNNKKKENQNNDEKYRVFQKAKSFMARWTVKTLVCKQRA